MSKVSRGPKSVKPKAIYRVNNWSSYNRALIARGSLTLRCLLAFSLRQTQGFIYSILVFMGLDDALVVPNYSTLSRRQINLAIAMPIKPTKEPIHLVVDSTGLKVSNLAGIFAYMPAR